MVALFSAKLILNEKYSFTIDTKVTLAGERRYTPIDLDASILEGEAVLNMTSALDNQYDDYFKTDLKLTYLKNKKRYSQSMSFDLQNVFNTKNVFGETYDVRNREVAITNQLGFFLVVDYRLTF